MRMSRVMQVGVTGHRTLPDPKTTADRLAAGLHNLRRLGAANAEPPASLEILSALAEGADRLVAGVALSQPDTTLVAVLPLPQDDYVQDFPSIDSRREFEVLLARARLVETVPRAPTREAAYELAGHWIVEHSDILVALWDGEPARGQGGTADIVAFAVERARPILWIPVPGAARARA